MTKLHCIYVLLDETQQVFYVGKTCRPKTRIGRHIEEVRRGNHLAVYNKLRQVLERTKWKRDGIFKVIESGISENEIDAKEIFYIQHYREQGAKLKNLTDGGEGGKGFTREIIERAAAKRRGQHHSEEWKQRISDSKKGISFSESHKQALKRAWKKRPPVSKETLTKRSMSSRGVINIKRFVVQSPSGERYITEKGLSEFCRGYGLDVRNLHATLTGRRKQHRGWKIIEETT